MRAARAGRRNDARAAFQAVLDQDPVNETAFLWLGFLADDPHVSLTHISQALEAHPQSPRAYAALQWAWRQVASSPPGTAAESRAAVPVSGHPRRRRRAKRAVVGLPVLGFLLLLAVVVGWTIGLTPLAEPPAMAALASGSLDSSPPAVTHLPAPSMMPSPTPRLTDTPLPTWIPVPTPADTPTSAPSPPRPSSPKRSWPSRSRARPETSSAGIPWRRWR